MKTANAIKKFTNAGASVSVIRTPHSDMIVATFSSGMVAEFFDESGNVSCLGVRQSHREQTTFCRNNVQLAIDCCK